MPLARLVTAGLLSPSLRVAFGLPWDWANARIGVAFMSNNRETVQGFDHTYRDLKASRWPAAQAEFPHNPAGHIPDVVRNLRAKSSLPD